MLAVERAGPEQKALMEASLADFDRQANATLRTQMLSVRDAMQAAIILLQQMLAHTDSLLAQMPDPQ